MKGRNERRILPNLRGYPERYFMALEFVVLMLTMLYMIYMVFGTVNGILETAAKTSKIEMATVSDQINYSLLVRIATLFIVAYVINILLGLFFLHRLTGPLVRIRTVLTKIASGTIPSTDVTLRKGDFPTDVAEALTDALKRIRSWRD